MAGSKSARQSALTMEGKKNIQATIFAKRHADKLACQFEFRKDYSLKMWWTLRDSVNCATKPRKNNLECFCGVGVEEISEQGYSNLYARSALDIKHNAPKS